MFPKHVKMMTMNQLMSFAVSEKEKLKEKRFARLGELAAIKRLCDQVESKEDIQFMEMHIQYESKCTEMHYDVLILKWESFMLRLFAIYHRRYEMHPDEVQQAAQSLVDDHGRTFQEGLACITKQICRGCGIHKSNMKVCGGCGTKRLCSIRCYKRYWNYGHRMQCSKQLQK